MLTHESLSMTPRCAAYLNSMNVKIEEASMNEYWAALCIAESFSDKALKKFGGINFHVMKGPQLLKRMEEFLEFYSTAKSKKTGKHIKPGSVRKPITNVEIEAAKTAKGGFSRKVLSEWGVPWPAPKGWRKSLLKNGIPYTAT